jgi:hypothetical protein
MPVMSEALAAAARISAPAWPWWTGELSAMAPALRRRPRNSCDIHVGSAGTLIEHVKDGTGQRLAEERSLEELDAEAWQQIASLTDNAATRLVLAAPQVFTTTIRLPLAARGRLRQAVALQLSEISPLNPSLLTWDAKFASSEKTSITVVVAMARAARVEQLSSLFAQNGIDVPRIVAFESGCVLTLSSEKLLTGEYRLVRNPWVIAAALVASVPFTTIGGARFLTSLEEARSEALQQELAPRQAQERSALRAEAQRQSLKLVLGAPPAAQAIEALALAMPEGSFARAAQGERGGSLAFTVDTPEPEQLADAMRKVPGLANAAVADMAPSGEGRMQVAYRNASR